MKIQINTNINSDVWNRPANGKFVLIASFRTLENIFLFFKLFIGLDDE